MYDGCYSAFRRRCHGSRAGEIDRTRFVVCIQNHDQVGNRARGDRLGSTIARGEQRLACGLLLLSPCVPLLFMGEEYGEERPFPFFCSFADPVIIEAVQRGRRREFAEVEFQWRVEIPDPQDPAHVRRRQARLGLAGGFAAMQLRQLYRDLLLARRRWPALCDRRHTAARVLRGGPGQDAAAEPPLLALERGGEGGNSGRGEPCQDAAVDRGRARSPAPGTAAGTEDAALRRMPRRKTHLPERILAHELLIFGGKGTRP